MTKKKVTKSLALLSIPMVGVMMLSGCTESEEKVNKPTSTVVDKEKTISETNIFNKEKYKSFNDMRDSFKLVGFNYAVDPMTFLIKESIALNWGTEPTDAEIKTFAKNIEKTEGEQDLTDKDTYDAIKKLARLKSGTIPFFKEYYDTKFDTLKANNTNIYGMTMYGDTELTVENVPKAGKLLKTKGNTLAENIKASKKYIGGKADIQDEEYNIITMNNAYLDAMGYAPDDRDTVIDMEKPGDNYIIASQGEDTETELTNTAYVLVHHSTLDDSYTDLLKVTTLINQDIEDKGFKEFYADILSYLQKKGLKVDKDTQTKIDQTLKYLDEGYEPEDADSENADALLAMRSQVEFSFSDILTMAYHSEKDYKTLNELPVYKEQVK